MFCHIKGVDLKISTKSKMDRRYMYEYIYENKEFIFLFCIIMFFILFDIFFYYFTKFEKNVTVKAKYVRNKGKRNRYMLIMSDVENNIYHIQNRTLSWEFDEAEDWNLITIGKTYKISGYKKRIPALGMYPIILEITPIE